MATSYVALLRGINVGGRNRILMADLRAAFESAGYGDVRTYIQSGNVVFRAEARERAELVDSIERMLAQAFGYSATVEVRDQAQMEAVVASAPAAFGAEPAAYRYDVLFALPPLTAAEVLEVLTLKEGIDTASPGPGVVYTTRLIERATQSGLSRIASHPVYQRLTVRNWNTTTKLLAMTDEDGPGS